MEATEFELACKTHNEELVQLGQLVLRLVSASTLAPALNFLEHGRQWSVNWTQRVTKSQIGSSFSMVMPLRTPPWHRGSVANVSEIASFFFYATGENMLLSSRL